MYEVNCFMFYIKCQSSIVTDLGCMGDTLRNQALLDCLSAGPSRSSTQDRRGGESTSQRHAVSRTIKAPVDLVFTRISDVHRFAEVSDDILEIEFLSGITHGVGTRFKETRNLNGRTATTEIEVTEYVENAGVRFVSDAGSTIWDTVMIVTARGDATELSMTMDARPYTWMAKLVNVFIKGMVTKAVTRDMDKLKMWCETH